MCAKKQDGLKVKTSVSLDQEVMEWLKEKAQELDRSVSWIINDTLKVKANDKSNR